jgi:hypothetical protein
MRSRTLRLASVLAAVLLSWSAAARADVIFGLNNVVFDDGGTSAGVFDINTYGYAGAPQGILTTAGTAFDASTYTGTPGTLVLNSFTTLVFYIDQTELDPTVADPFNTNVAEQDVLVVGGASFEKCDTFGGCTWGVETVAKGTSA